MPGAAIRCLPGEVGRPGIHRTTLRSPRSAHPRGPRRATPGRSDARQPELTRRGDTADGRRVPPLCIERVAGAGQDVQQPVGDLLLPAGACQLQAGGATRGPLRTLLVGFVTRRSRRPGEASGPCPLWGCSRSGVENTGMLGACSRASRRTRSTSEKHRSSCVTVATARQLSCYTDTPGLRPHGIGSPRSWSSTASRSSAPTFADTASRAHRHRRRTTPRIPSGLRQLT